MKAYYRKNETIGVSMCDASGCLGIPNCFALFQDIAAEHAELLGVGRRAMQAQDAFWITTRTRVHFVRRPEMMQTVEIATWPAAPGVMRCDRYYRMESEGAILAEGRTEWCVLNLSSGRPVSPAQMFGPEIVYHEDSALTAPYARFRHDFSEDELAVRREVRPSDVDVGRHMNNVAYLRLICDAFSVAELEALEVEEMEIWFSMPCFEGDVLEVLRRRTDYGYEFGVRRPDGRYAALVQMKVKA